LKIEKANCRKTLAELVLAGFAQGDVPGDDTTLLGLYKYSGSIIVPRHFDGPRLCAGDRPGNKRKDEN
jgi:hypothetical protein